MIEKILQIFSTKDLKNFKRNRMFILKFYSQIYFKIFKK